MQMREHVVEDKFATNRIGFSCLRKGNHEHKEISNLH